VTEKQFGRHRLLLFLDLLAVPRSRPLATTSFLSPHPSLFQHWHLGTLKHISPEISKNALNRTSVYCIESVLYVLYVSEPVGISSFGGFANFLTGVSLSLEDPLLDSLYLWKWERLESSSKIRDIRGTHAVQEGSIAISQQQYSLRRRSVSTLLFANRLNGVSTKHDPQILNPSVSPGRVHLALIIHIPHRLDPCRYIRFTQTTDRISEWNVADIRRQFKPSHRVGRRMLTL